MFLKQLDVVGFKSFAERISVEFVPGVTAVVGPNGSGKSNITDAIRWVLGEQSVKQLRGSKMEDIIFAGSDSRKPLNFAEVTLTLQNDDHFLPVDYHEVSVTRRVYRSGESEFYINKQACRLKDIVDLFMDSGLGREAFSIISQGKVEEILSSKAEERRSIFEEAAGVLKYKHRKRKAVLKLTETQDNLNRVEDILHEIEGQLEPLQMQSSIAKDYLEKKEELEKTEVALTVHEIEELHGNWEQLLVQFEQNKDLEIELSSKIQGKEAEVENNREKIQTLDESITELQEVLLIASKELEKLEGQKEVLKERKKNASQNRSQLEKQIAEYKTSIEKYNTEIEMQASLLNNCKNDLTDSQSKLTALQKEFDLVNQDLEGELEQLKSEYIELLNKQASIKNEVRYLEEQEKQQHSKKERLTKNNEQFIEARKEIQERKQAFSEKLEQKRQEIEEQIKNYTELARALEKKKEDYAKKESKLYSAYQYLQQYRSRKQMLEEMQDDYSGFYQGVKGVLKAKLDGVEGAVAELISVEKQYETAIEIALGGAMQHVVVDNEANARNAIQYLKRNGLGRATFLPLSVIKEKKVHDSQQQLLKSNPSYIGIAADLVKHDSRYRSIIYNLLGTVIVTKDLKAANEIARMVQYRFRIVTLEGDVVNPGGSMTGGAVKQKSSSILSRQRELETLTKSLTDLEVKTEKFENQVKDLKEQIAIEEKQCSHQKEVGEQLRFDEQEFKGKLREVEIEEKNINERLELYDLEVSGFIDEQEKRQSRIDELKETLTVVTSEGNRFEQKIEQLTEQKKTAQESKDRLQTEITELKVKVAEQQQLFRNENEKHDRLLQELAKSKEDLKDSETYLTLLSDQMNTSSSGEGKLQETIQQKEHDKEKTLELISSRRKERLHTQMLLEDHEHDLKELKRQHKQLLNALKDEEVKINRLDVELENRLNHLREEYMLTYEGAKEKYPLTIEADEARKKVKLIKLAIDELGTVNLGAIEEYDRILERYEFLTEQRDDLLEAKDTLHRIIDEMDEEMVKRFETSFFSIKAEFEIVFKELFGGGRADLQLTHPDDLLNTGVDIVAQPPGKKLQNLGLLSGGERALTAIALLFAILRVRPVPFCVLDEVEAALDEANVNRFAKYLNEFSKETQFIVITHRKGTMEEADVLYGVTMQESGVSRLVSVRLEDSKELVE